MDYELRITQTTPRHDGARWINGTIDGFRFQALVFSEHAENADYELGDSRISKLWMCRLDTKVMVYNFDRGLDFEAATDETQAAVDFLAAGLAEHTYAR